MTNQYQKGVIAAAILSILAAGFWFFTKQKEQEEKVKPSQQCLVPGPLDGSPVESTCSDSKIECHWQVYYCEEWYDEPTDCAKLSPPAQDINYGTVTWENYYCGCDMKCHPKGECKDGNKSEMVQQKCSGKYGWGECPSDAFTCYWKDVNDSNVHCPIPKCCGGWCSAWSPC
jgi:hypothetical protein